MSVRRLLCYLEGRGDEWEALCLDLDIAVHGHSESEVRALLSEAVRTYFEDAAKELPTAQARLLARRVPPRVRIGLIARLLWHVLEGGNNGPDFEGRFQMPCPA